MTPAPVRGRCQGHIGVQGNQRHSNGARQRWRDEPVHRPTPVPTADLGHMAPPERLRADASHRLRDDLLCRNRNVFEHPLQPMRPYLALAFTPFDDDAHPVGCAKWGNRRTSLSRPSSNACYRTTTVNFTQSQASARSPPVGSWNNTLACRSSVCSPVPESCRR